MLFAQTDLDRIREAYPDVLRYYGVDPHHDFKPFWREGHKANAHYDAGSNLVTDFGRDERYNVFELIGLVEGIGTDKKKFPEQVEKAASILGLQVGKEASSTPTSPKPKVARPRFEPPAEAGFTSMPIEPFEFMRGKLFDNETALGYLLSRGFDKPKICHNRLGWVPNLKVLLKDDGSPMFTKYEPHAPHGFIVIPFMDREATTVSYAMLRTVPGKQPPMSKEIRPSGYRSPLYREWLLSVNCKVLFVCEGLLDTLALEMLIGRPCLGLGGANFTKRLCSVLYATPEKLRPQKVVLALDADAEGQKAAAKIAVDLDYLGIPHANFDMPVGCKDPCDVLQQLGGV